MRGILGIRGAIRYLHVVAIAVACQFSCFLANAEVLVGRVVKVADGDTITVLDDANFQRKIRLAGIDAPERNQPFGNVSRLSLSQLVAGKTVRVEINKTDRYGRAVGSVWAGDLDVNRRQVERGMAWWYQAYAHEQSPTDRIAYAQAQDAARKGRYGLWVDKNPIPPWDWRHATRRPVDFSRAPAWRRQLESGS
jgi:endonuclease YncB( thermonuclease family)